MAGIDGKMYGEMVISAANALENQKEDINNLNFSNPKCSFEMIVAIL